MAAIASQATSVQVAAARNRSSITFENSDVNRVYLRFGTTAATATDYHFSLGQNENAKYDNVNGPVQAIWAADGTGSLMVLEVDPFGGVL